MNFIKNSFNKLFGKQQDKSTSKNQAAETVNVPDEELKQLFQLIAQSLSQNKQPVPDQIKLQLYGLYKQATIGDCNTLKPAIYEFVNKAKWDSWDRLKGMSKANAMKNYIATSVKADKDIQKKILAQLSGEDYIQGDVTIVNKYDSFGLKTVEQEDFSDKYSHPYFKKIEKGQPISQITHQLLLQVNNSPKVYPLHFAIDKQRTDLVASFLPLLSVKQIQEMKDEDGTGILEYAQLIENEEILKLIHAKIKLS